MLLRFWLDDKVFRITEMDTTDGTVPLKSVGHLFGVF